MSIWQAALNVWLLLVGLTWIGSITATSHFLGLAAIIVVVIYVVELFWGHREWFATRRVA